MANLAHRLPHRGGLFSAKPVTLFVVPEARREPPRCCELVARTLRCRWCAISLRGPDGSVLVEESIGGGIDPSGSAGADGVASLNYPVALPDGTTGVVRAGDRIDGGPFGVEDLNLLEHLIAFYVSTFDVPSWREKSRLRGELRAVRARSIRAKEEERQRLARELHDGVGHTLTAAILGLDVQAQCLPDGDAARAALIGAREALAQCADHLHACAFQLRPRVLNDLGLMPALRSLARRVRETGAVSIEVTIRGRERRLSDDTELAAFRIAQESLTNALKYARAARIAIDVAFTAGGLEVSISDDGVGFAPGAKHDESHRHGQGLAGMRERAELEGGVFEVRSRPGQGTTVWTRLPIGEGRHE